MKEFNYKTARQSKSVVILAAGPSLVTNTAIANKYIKENNSVVIGTNYNYPIKSDYTFYGDPDRLDNSGLTNKSKAIIIAYDMPGRFKNRYGKKKWDKITKSRTVYWMGRNFNKKAWRYNMKQHLRTTPEGGLMFRPGTSAFAAMMVASACRPKKLLVVGLDGPEKPNRKRKFKKKNFDGIVRNYRSYTHWQLKKRMLKRKVVPFLQQRGVEIECFSNCPFWSIHTDRIGIKIILV